MYIQETKEETGHNKIKSLLQRVQVHSRVQGQAHNLRSVRVLNQAQNRHNARVLNQVRGLQLEQVINFNEIIRTEAEGILIIIAINIVVLLQVKEVISRDLSQDPVVAEVEEDKLDKKREAELYNSASLQIKIFYHCCTVKLYLIPMGLLFNCEIPFYQHFVLMGQFR